MSKTFSVEDGNPSVSTILGTRSVQYRDIDLTFTNKTVSGEIFKKTESAAVKQAVKNLCMTNFAEKPFLPSFGGNIRSLLFELADEDTEEEIEDNVISAINRFEPRAEIIKCYSKLKSRSQCSRCIYRISSSKHTRGSISINRTGKVKITWQQL